MESVSDSASPDSVGRGAALLVVDVQQGLFGLPEPLYNGEQLIETLNALIERARAAGAPVLFIQHANKTTLVRGSAAWQLHEDLLFPLRTEALIHKAYGNAFEETKLQEVLSRMRVDTLVIGGLVTQGCIKATCEGALERGYHVVLVRDGHSALGHRAADAIAKWNKKLGARGAILRDAAEVHFCTRILAGPGGSAGAPIDV